MFTEEEARRLAAILTDTVVQPIDPRLERIEKEIPRAPTPANIIMALQTLIELDDLELSDVKAHAGGVAEAACSTGAGRNLVRQVRHDGG